MTFDRRAAAEVWRQPFTPEERQWFAALYQRYAHEPEQLAFEFYQELGK